MSSERLVTDVYELAEPGVFVVKDDTTRVAYISASNNILMGISRIVGGIKSGNFEFSGRYSTPKVDVVFIGANPKFHSDRIMTEYAKKGYSILNNRSHLRLSARMRMLDYKDSYVGAVTLRSARGNEYVVAAFDDIVECEEWFSTYYPNSYVENVIELNDPLTREVKKLYNGKELSL